MLLVAGIVFFALLVLYEAIGWIGAPVVLLLTVVVLGALVRRRQRAQDDESAGEST